jgi:hypothetical protein
VLVNKEDLYDKGNGKYSSSKEDLPELDLQAAIHQTLRELGVNLFVNPITGMSKYQNLFNVRIK